MTSAGNVGSTSLVTTSRPARYGKQLTSHLSRRLQTTWDEDAGAGVVTFDHGHCDLTSTPEGLLLRVEVAAGTDPSIAQEQVARMEDVVGRHLVRFGARDELVAHWRRDDGSPGPTQVNTGEHEH